MKFRREKLTNLKAGQMVYIFSGGFGVGAESEEYVDILHWCIILTQGPKVTADLSGGGQIILKGITAALQDHYNPTDKDKVDYAEGMIEYWAEKEQDFINTLSFYIEDPEQSVEVSDSIPAYFKRIIVARMDRE